MGIFRYLFHCSRNAYTHRVAISNHRLVAFENDRVSFRWRDYAHGGKKKVMTVSAHEFLRRFLLHVLPGGLVRIRHFGLFANRRRNTSLQRCRALLGMAVCVHPPQPPSLRCPAWSGIMLVVERLTCGRRACDLLQTAPSKITPPALRSRVLCWRPVGRSDLNVVAKFPKLLGQRPRTMNEEFWFVLNALLDVANSFVQNLPDQAA
jgi:hypothetical protein